jgi:hypothetical protein
LAEQNLSLAELESIGKKALLFQSYVLRRAFGEYYAAWAVALFCFLLIPELVFSQFGYVLWAEACVFGADVAIGIVTTVFTRRSFQKSARTAALRRTLRANARGMGGRYTLFLWWGVFAALAALALLFSSIIAYSLLYGILLVIDLLLYTWLRRSFPDGIPGEGKLAVVTYGGGAVASFVLSLLNGYSIFSGAPWAVVVAVWLFSSMYAFKRAPEELVDLSY